MINHTQNIELFEDSEFNRKKIIIAKDILSKIEKKEPVEYHQAIILGDLDLCALNLAKRPVKRSKEETEFIESNYGRLLCLDANSKSIVSSSIEFYDCRIEGHINFSNVIFLNSIVFDHTSFGEEGCYFYCSEFYGNKISFDFTRFVEEVSFSYAKFYSDLSFEFSKLECGVLFENVEFHKGFNFLGSRMMDIGDFVNTIFHFNADFRGANFENFANFDGAKFLSTADFAEASFQGTSFFNEVYFHDNVSLKRAKIYNMEFYPRCHDNSMINLNDSNITRLKMDWKMMKKHIVYDDAVYLSFVENFNKQALFDYADDCYYEYNLKAKAGIKDFFAFLLCQYGIYTRHVLIWTALIILVYIIGNTILREYSLIGIIADKVLSWIIIPLLIVIFSKRFSK